MSTKTDRTATIAAAAKKTASLADVASKVAQAQKNELTDAASAARVSLIEAAYKAQKTSAQLERDFYVYFVRDIVKPGGALNTALPHFKNAIVAMFEAGQLETVGETEETDRVINAETLYAFVRRLLMKANARYEKAQGGNGTLKNDKGSDERDDEIKGASFFKSGKLAEIAEAFTVQDEKRQEKIITTLFLQITPERRAALLLDLEAMQDAEVPELDDIK